MTLSVLVLAAPVTAQTPPDDPDRDINFAQPDFTLVALPTTLRVPKFKSAFRVTHRFTRPLNEGSFGDLASDLFGLDSGAQIGLEYRFGIMRATQIGIPQDLGSDDRVFRSARSAGAGQRISRDRLGAGHHGRHEQLPRQLFTRTWRGDFTNGAESTRRFYLEPIWVNNSNSLPSEVIDDNDSVLLGVGARLRVRPTVYLTLEGVPRVAGYDPGSTQIGFGLEKRSGGHVFQLVFSNGFGTTIGQVARGASNNDDWYLGFSISRKFY